MRSRWRPSAHHFRIDAEQEKACNLHVGQRSSAEAIDPSCPRQHGEIRTSRLASQELQEKFCIRGTANEYLLPEELLDSAFNWAQAAIKQSEFSPAQLNAIAQFLAVVGQSADLIPINNAEITPADLILRDPGWRRVRDAALNCLKRLGLDLDVSM